MQNLSVLAVGVVIGLVLTVAVLKLSVRVKSVVSAWMARRKAAALTLEQRVLVLEAAEAARVAAVAGAVKTLI
jgi:hypothetical protein